MKTINIRNWKTGKIIFSYECEDNTIEKTLKKANYVVNLSYVDLRNMDLSGADLKSLNLVHANFSNSIMRRTSLDFSNLKYAIFDNVDMQDSSLYYAKFVKCIITNTNLSYSSLLHSKISDSILDNVNLNESYLTETNLIDVRIKNSSLNNVNLFNTKLKDTHFEECSLFKTIFENFKLYNCLFVKCDFNNSKFKFSDLSNSNFIETNFKNVRTLFIKLPNLKLNSIIGINDQCPKESSFIGWKKCILNNGYPCIVKLEIPADAKRCSGTTNKCRCNKARVLEIQNLDDTKIDIGEAYSYYNSDFKYKVSEIVEPDSFDEDFWVECGHGIHFFMDREDAVNY